MHFPFAYNLPRLSINWSFCFYIGMPGSFQTACSILSPSVVSNARRALCGESAFQSQELQVTLNIIFSISLMFLLRFSLRSQLGYAYKDYVLLVLLFSAQFNAKRNSVNTFTGRKRHANSACLTQHQILLIPNHPQNHINPQQHETEGG